MSRTEVGSVGLVLSRAVLSVLLLGWASVASAGLEVTKSIQNGLTTVPSGQTFTYKLQYRAASTTTDFFGATLTDILPPGIEYQSLVGTVHVASFAYTAATRTLRVVFIDPLPAGSTGEILVNVRFPQGVTLPGTVATNTATMAAINAPPAVAPPVTITATAANRATATKSLVGGSVPLDQNVTYTVSANNSQTAGALNATALTLLDNLPTGAVFVAASGGGVYDPGSHTVTWTAASLSAGSTFSRTLTIMYPSSAFALGAKATNDLSVTLTPLGGVPTNLTARTVHNIVAPVANSTFTKDVNANYVYEGKTASKTWTFALQNTGNVPLYDVVVTDAIPAQVQVTSINSGLSSGTPPGLNDPIGVFYKTTLNGTWTNTPGSPYPGSASVTVPVSTLGLAPGEFITDLKWEFGTLPVGYSIGSLQFASTILTNGWDGQPVLAGQTITNVGRLAYTDFTGPKTKSDPATIPVKTARPVAELAKSASPSTVNDGSVTTFTIRLTNRSEAAQPLIDPVLADLLDAKLVYVPGSWTVASKPAGAPDPLFETIPNFTGSRTLLRWRWDGAASYSLPANSYIEMRFRANIPAGTIYGGINNDLTLAKWSNTALDTASATGITDTFDLDGDGITAETVYYRRTALTVTARASMDSVKWVRGELDADWSKYPNSGLTVPGGRADYRLIVSNTGNVPIRNAAILDILPTLDDTGVIDLSQRDTEWKSALAGPVVAPPGVTVYYSRELDPTRLDFDPSGPPGSEPAYWSTNPPATLIEARALKFVFTGIVIQPGASYELTWPMRAPVATPTDGRVAWNSFGYYGTRTDSSTLLLPSEPIKVGIAVQPDTNAVYGDRVWYDTNRDGVQDAAETGVNGIRVRFYEDSGAGGFPDGVVNTNVDRYVGYTITADDFNGQAGYYLFPNLDRGHYYAVFDIPPGYEVSPKDAGTDDAQDSDVDALTGAAPITWLDDEETDLTWDLGLFIVPPVGISIVKTAGTAPDGGVYWTLPGTPVTYTYRVTNTGELAIVRMTVSDDKLGLVGMIDGPLAPGASTTLTKASSALSAGVTNVGSVVGHPASSGGREIPGAPPVRDDDDAIVHIYASIGDLVWYDVNRNGIQDAGEAGVGGVRVVLYDGAGAPIATNTTAANGRYRFNGLLPGDYSVGFTTPAGYLLSPNDQGADDAKDSDADLVTGRTVTTTLVAGEYDSTWDMGLWNLASIGDTVWYDVNRNGIQDAGETGVAGATVTLYDAGGAVVATTNTSATGFYTFTRLMPGNYSLGFVPPTGYLFSAADQGANDAKDSDAIPATGRTIATTLSVGENDMTWDAGLWRPASIGDFVWYDANTNGLQDIGEAGVAGVLVTLYNGLGQVVATTNTDAAGRYGFINLVPGDYSVGFARPTDYLFSRRDAGGDDTADSDADTTTGRTAITTLAPGENDLTWDAGMYLVRASIGDRVWHDVNANGVQYPAETGVPNVVVNLFRADGSTLVGTTSTDANGHYGFPNLEPGDYLLAFTPPAGYQISPRDQGSDASDSDVDPISGRTIATTLAPGEDDLTWDLGIYRLASLGDTVWDDSNGDGVQDPGEPGVPNVTVTLYGAGGAVLATMPTDASGNYLFPGLVPGVYSVGFALPAGYAFTLRDQGGDGADSDADTTTGRTITTTLQSGENDLTWDAGIYRPVSLGDRVWLDVDRDGVQEAGEAGFAGITVTLYNAGGSAISNRVTDVSGNYFFGGLPPGTYHVGFAVPIGYALTVANQGDDALDSDADLVTGLTPTTTLRSGQSDLTLDAGMYRLTADLELTKTATRDCFPPKWTIPISKGEQYVTGDYWLRIENNQPSFDVWGPGSMMAGVDISRTWHQVAGRFTRGPAAWGPHKMEILVDGVVVATSSQWGTTDTSSAALFLGSYLGTHYFYAGAMDEVRLSGTARSDAWMRTSVAQQNSPSTFLTTGAEAAGTVYGYEKTLTVQGSAVAGALTDFPVLVSLVDADLAARVGTAEGWDIGFTLPDGTPLAHEVEQYYASSGTLVAWVKLPALAAGTDTTFVMHYGDAAVAAATETPADVWDADFRMVQHFEETTGPVLDSTANGNDGVVSGAWFTAAGSADGAYLFDGVDDQIEVPDSPSVRFVNTDFTIEGWYARELPRKEFVVTVTNRGPDQATRVTVLDPLGTTMGYVTSDASQGTYDPATGIWTVGTMDLNTVARLVLVVDPLAASVVNRAEVATSDAADPDSTPGNGVVGEDDQAQASPPGCGSTEPPVGPGVPDSPAIQIVKVAGTAPDGTVLTVASGANVTYTYTVYNIGNVTLTGITVTDDKLGAVGVVPTLLIGQSAVLTAVASNVTADVTNVATAVGNCGAAQATDTDNAVVVIGTGGSSGGGVPAIWDRADFAVTHQEFIGPAPTVVGEVFAVRVTVANRGQIAGNAGNLGVFVAHADPVVIGEAGQAQVSIGVLQPGQSRTLEIGGLVATERGTQLLRSYADIGDLTDEWSEGDNQLTLMYQISPIFMQIQPVAGKIELSWNSYWGDRYIVYRAAGLGAPYVPLATGIEATPPTNGFIDTNPPAGGAFYKVGVQPWAAW